MMENHQQGPLEHEIPPVIQERALGGDIDQPGKGPDEVQPGQGDFDRPDSAPLEESPGVGDTDQPGETPTELPPPD